MKRVGNIFSQVYDIDNLRLAHKKASLGKGWYEEVKVINENPDYYLYRLQDMLKSHTFKTSKYEIFYKKEKDKIRKLYKLPYFPDRVAQWALLLVIAKYIIRHFIFDTYSAIPDRGIHLGVKRIRHAITTDPEGCKYCYKMDMRHYYQSINHEILKQKYRRIFKDEDVLWMIDEIIDSVNTCEDDDLYEIYIVLLEEDIDPNTGEPIGNYMSQFSGNYYVSDFDHWLKEKKHVKYYFRYMDDVVILAGTKEELRQLNSDIQEYLKENLKLRVKNNWQIFPTYVRGVDFLGYRFFKDFTLLRKDTCKSFKKKMKAIETKVKNGQEINYSEWCSINSYNGWLKHCDSHRLKTKYMKNIIPHANEYYERMVKVNGNVA